jgi:hypothetical protein
MQEVSNNGSSSLGFYWSDATFSGLVEPMDSTSSIHRAKQPPALVEGMLSLGSGRPMNVHTFIPKPSNSESIHSVVTSDNRLYPVDRQGVRRDGSEAKFSVMPSFLEGATYIVTANEDKFAKGEEFLSFELARDGDIYVAYDARYSHIPRWLALFQETAEEVAFTFGGDNYPMKLYKKYFGKGSVELGGS